VSLKNRGISIFSLFATNAGESAQSPTQEPFELEIQEGGLIQERELERNSVTRDDG
jgi:hypothetical protein